MEKNIDIHHVTRIEGHGDIVVRARDDGSIERIEWRIPEAPRFFEAIVRGQSYDYLPFITSRICGICSIGHTIASIKAVESALSVEISEQTEKLRKLALHAENMQSHILHVGFLVLPDLFRRSSLLDVIKENRDMVKKILEIHRLANRFSDLIAGRTTHPITMRVGGFSSYPSEDDLRSLKKELKEGKNLLESFSYDVERLMDRIPDFSRETEFISLSSNTDYPFYEGKLKSSETGLIEGDYMDHLREYVVSISTAKHSFHVRESYMVGALARFNINSDNLSDFSKQISSIFGIKPICFNPFMNSIAQIIEIAHNIENSINLIDDLLSTGIKDDRSENVIVRAGRGVGLIEVPRGVLIHDYTFDGRGRCTHANLVIPTNQNHANIQKDMEKLVPEIINMPKEEIEFLLEMLVRAYDPCISCSTHDLKVKIRWEN